MRQQNDNDQDISGRHKMRISFDPFDPASNSPGHSPENKKLRNGFGGPAILHATGDSKLRNIESPKSVISDQDPRSRIPV